MIYCPFRAYIRNPERNCAKLPNGIAPNNQIDVEKIVDSGEICTFATSNVMMTCVYEGFDNK